MKASERRERILKHLEKTHDVTNATVLSEKFGVTRQIIVSDIALLRAKGYKIVAEKRGYYIDRSGNDGFLETVVCRHDKDKTFDEFCAVVDNGGKVLNVIIEHPLYGQICADMRIASRYDAEEFLRRANEVNAPNLSELTDGLHIHTVSAPDEASLERIKSKLRESGILEE